MHLLKSIKLLHCLKSVKLCNLNLAKLQQCPSLKKLMMLYLLQKLFLDLLVVPLLRSRRWDLTSLPRLHQVAIPSPLCFLNQPRYWIRLLHRRNQQFCQHLAQALKMLRRCHHSCFLLMSLQDSKPMLVQMQNHLVQLACLILLRRMIKYKFQLPIKMITATVRSRYLCLVNQNLYPLLVRQ